jgi:TonB family protein
MVKKIVILIVLVLLTNFAYSQVDTLEFSLRKCDVYGMRDWIIFPVFDKNFLENDFEKLYDFVFENLKYPETVKADKPVGQGFIEFWIDTNGYTSEHKVIQSVRQDLDDEYLRVYKLIKFDVPAKNYDNEPIGMCFQLPFRFTLDENAKPFKKSIKDKPIRKTKLKGSGGSLKEGNTEILRQ